jgi:hypothetical protein
MLRGVMVARLPSTNRRGSPQVAGENGREGERYVVISVAFPSSLPAQRMCRRTVRGRRSAFELH